MRNKLDAKAIVDKAALLELLDLLCLEGNTDDVQRVRYMLRRMKRDLEQQDLTDWVAAPRNADTQMLLAGDAAFEDIRTNKYLRRAYRIDMPEECVFSDKQIMELAKKGRYQAMLEASPPLPTGRANSD